MFTSSIKVKNQIFYYILNLKILPESIRNNYRAGDIFTIVTSNTICMLKDNEHISLETIFLIIILSYMHLPYLIIFVFILILLINIKNILLR